MVRGVSGARGPRSSPRVSVAVASYNYGRYLEQCVRSALDQPGVDVEVLVVDDASSDDSVEVARRLAEQDPRVRVTVHETNHGHIATFNEALWSATGDYVVKLDSDDVLTPGSLARGAAVLDAHPRVGLVYGNPLTFEHALPDPRTSVRSVRVWEGDGWLRTRCRRATNVIMQPEAMVRTSVLHRTDGHRATCPAAHDLNLWLRLAALADVARIQGADQGFYRVHRQSLLRSRYGGYLSDLQQRRLAFEDFYATLDPERSRELRADELRRRTTRALSRQALRHATRLLRTGEEGPDAVASYLAFAHDVHPASSRDRASRVLADQVERGRRDDRELDRVLEALRILEDKVRWRRWRRFGT